MEQSLDDSAVEQDLVGNQMVVVGIHQSKEDHSMMLVGSLSPAVISMHWRQPVMVVASGDSKLAVGN